MSGGRKAVIQEAHQRIEQFRQRMLRFKLCRIVWHATESYYEHNGVFLSAALSFYSIVSLIPLSFIAFWALSVAVTSATAQLQLEGLLNQYLLPETTEMVIDQVRLLAERGILSILGAWWGVLMFIWAGIRYFELLQMTLNRAWGGSEMRTFWRRKLLTIGAFIVAGVLVGVAIFLSMWMAAFDKLETVFGFSLGTFLETSVRVLPFIFSVLVFVLLYKFMPTVKVPWLLALGTGVPVGFAWEITKRVFTYLVASSKIYDSIYGPMASFILLMIWVYTSAIIVLFGAEMGAAWQHQNEEERNNTIASPSEPQVENAR